MSEITYSGYNYPPTFIFPDRVNIPKEFEILDYDDNELLIFEPDEFGRFSIIKLSRPPYVRYDLFNWDYRGQDSKYKWYYINPSGKTVYRLYPSGNKVPIDSGSAGFWQNADISGYLMYGLDGQTNYSGYFKEDTFVRTDMKEIPSGWIKPNDPYPILGDVEKIKHETLLKHQYKPVKLTLGIERTNTNDTIEGKDITNYKQNRIPILDRNIVNSIQTLEYYFDGKNLITNYNFSDPDIQKNVHAEYEYSLDKVKVIANLYTNKKGRSDYTPVLDNYILKISTQKVTK